MIENDKQDLKTIAEDQFEEKINIKQYNFIVRK